VSDVTERSGRLGEQLRRNRIAVGLTQEELALRSGLSVRAISNLERSRTRRPHPRTLRQLADALRLPAAELTAAPPQLQAPAQLPADLADFTGRRDQLRQLTAVLGRAGDEAPGAVLITVVAGAGGIGKTAFAVHLAHQAADCFPDGQLYLNLQGSATQPVAPRDALARMLRDLRAEPPATAADDGELAVRYRSLLAGRRLLILLDDARDAAQVRPLLPGTDGCAVLVTSRNSLSDLESARLVELGVLDGAEALTLFRHVAGEDRCAAEPEAVRAVLAACGGLPLAIRIAAARLAARPGWSVAALAVRLGGAHQRLDELQAGDLAVRASFMVSYAAVRGAAGPQQPGAGPPDRAFRLLTLAEGPDISLPAAAALLAWPVSRTEQALEQLVDAHLLQSPAPGRYRYHDLLRAFGAERVRAEEDQATRDQAVGRLLRWYLHTAAGAARQMNTRRSHVTLSQVGPDLAPLELASYAAALAWLDAEYANLVAAVGQAARQGEHEIAWKLPVTLWDLFTLRCHWGDWIATHETGLTSARLLRDRAAESWLLAHLGAAHLQAGRPLAAIDILRQAQVVYREVGDERGAVVAQLNLGLALTAADRLDDALRVLREALTQFTAMGHRNGEGIALCAIADISAERGRAGQAVTEYQLALVALREAGNPVTEGEALIGLSKAHLQLGQPEQAIEAARTAVRLNAETGNRLFEALSLTALGHALSDSGQPGQARQSWRAALAILTDLADPRAEEVAAQLAALKRREPAQARPLKLALSARKVSLHD
jgi:transcriptional regulator with XRE-family HTH domain/tetratricopeptide (TPR) repeat protein